MSLTLALQSALSGVGVSQVGLSVTSSNIANANTEGYTRKIAGLSSRVLGQQAVGAGVTIEDIYRNIDATIQKEMRIQTGTVNRHEVVQDYASRTEALFGSVSADDSLGAQITEFSNLFDAIAIAPNDPIRHNELLNMARGLTNDIRLAAQEIQTIRRDVDQEIERSVEEINQDLEIITDLNSRIVKNDVLDIPSGDMEDQRDAAILRVSGQLDINVFGRANKEIAIYTNTGAKLVDSNSRTLTYSAVNTIDSGTSVEEGNFSAIDFEGESQDFDLTEDIESGRLNGLLFLRDEFLTNTAAELEKVVSELSNIVNRLHNKGTAYPPPENLTGTRSINGTDDFYATGTMRFSVMNAQSELVDYVDIDMGALTSPSTVNDMIAAVNTATSAIDGQPFNTHMNMQIVDGKLSLSSVVLGNRVGIGTPDLPAVEAVEKLTGENQSVAQYFGLNNFFDNGTTNTNPATLLSGRRFQATDTIAGTGSIKLAVTNPDGTVKNNLTLDINALGPTATVADFVNAVNAAPGLEMTATLREDGVLRLKADNSDEGIEVNLLSPESVHTNTGKNMLAFLGLEDNRFISSSIEVSENLVNNPSLVARGVLNGQTYTGFQADPVPMVTAGDVDVAQAIADIFKEPINFSAVGTIGNITTTLTEYASLFLGGNATQNKDFQDNFNNTFAILSELELQNSAASGVDVEQEMAQLIVLENAYNASAQVIRVTQQMYDTLESIVS